MPRRNSHSDNWEFGGTPPREESAPQEPKPRLKRAATTLAFTALFFSGAALTAVAGDKFSSHMSADDAAQSDTTSTDAAPPAEAPSAADPAAAADPASAEAPAPESAPAPDPAAAPAADPSSAGASDPAAAAAATAAASDAGASASAPESPSSPVTASAVAAASHSQAHGKKGPSANGHSARASTVVLLPKVKPAPAPEIEGPRGGATVWLNSPAPDPTPPAKRLSASFARRLMVSAKASGLDWAFLLGILRAKGATGKVPADASTLGKLADRLANAHQDRGTWGTALAYGGSSEFADRAVALMRYDRAVGLNALVHGLESQKAALGQKLLSDPQILIYPGGRNDIISGKVDVRVLAVIAYLHEAYGQVTVSCLISGHRLYARPGVISAHIYGRAVDIAGLDGQSIYGNSAPGGLTEHAVRDLLLLPQEVMPQQIISLLGLGGPSFALANHFDHIHIGF